MKKFLTTTFIFSLLFLTNLSFGQQINDDCSGIVDMGLAPACPDTVIFNNNLATESDIGFDNFPPCFNGGTPQRDVWFSFVASDTILDYRICLTGCPDPDLALPSIINPQIAVYRGDCEFDGLQLLECISAANGESNLELDLNGLTPGITYFLRVNDWSATATPNWGAFKLCVKEKPPIDVIDEGMSTACSGTLVDTGGEDGDYGNDENNIFTICPSQLSNCITFSLEYFAVENFNDQILFFDGPDTNSPMIGSLNGSGFGNPINGGVCYEVGASSGCLTVQFTSDGSTTFEGFLGSWECSVASCDTDVPISVTTNIDNQTILDNISSAQTLVEIDTIICASGAMGTFTAVGSDLGLEKGLVLTSGNAGQIGGPGTFFSSLGNGMPGDDDLDYLSTINGNGSASQDACIIELDVFAATDELTFEYVFGSEEYPEFVNSTFNDIFTFLISGPGIVGDVNIANQLNIATLPDGTFVQINSVNGAANWEYYRNNEEGTSVVYDGLTSDFLGVKKSMTARADVEPCNTYHLKIAIADRGDSAFDSGVFLSEIKGGTPSLGVTYNSGIDYLVEECTIIPDELFIGLSLEQDDTVTYNVVVTGTATPGVDYEVDLPNTITFVPGDVGFTFPIVPLPDGIDEGIETLIIQLTNNFGCGDVVVEELIVEIHDNLLVEIFAGQDTAFVCEGNPIQVDAVGATSYFWMPPGIFTDANLPNPDVLPDTSMYISVLGTLGICSDVDSIWLEVVDPQVEIVALTPTDVCSGETVTLQAVNNIGDAGMLWNPAFLIPNNTDPIVTISPGFNTNITAQVELAGCVATDNIQINVDFITPMQVVTPDTSICQGYPVQLANPIPFTQSTFEWQPNIYLEGDNNTIPDAVASPEEDLTYIGITTSSNGFCQDTVEVTIDVTPADIAIEQDTFEICIGESVQILSTTTTGAVGLVWTPTDSLSCIDCENPIATPTETTTYYATLTVGACMVFDSLVVTVDSLPEMPITPDPFKDSYCEGDQIFLTSPTYEPANFPNIDFTWEEGPGQLTPDSFLNMVINALDTFTYIRHTENRGCSMTDSIEIIVIPVASLEINPQGETICPGESIDLTLTADAVLDDISWEPGTGLSCNDCFTPTATLDQTTTFEVSAETSGCPVFASVTVNVDSPDIAFPAPDICLDESIVLNTANNPSGNFTWSLPDGTIVSLDAAPSVTPTETTTYNVLATLGNCEVNESITIVVWNDPVVVFPSELTICQGDEITLNSNSEQNVNYNWTANPGDPSLNATDPLPTVTPTQTTTYSVNASNVGCSVDAAVQVEVLEAPAFILAAEPATNICPGDFIELNSASSANATYTWTSDPVDATLDPNEPQPSVSPITTTTYSMSADNGVCAVNGEVTIIVAEDFPLTASEDQSICFTDFPITLLANVEDFPNITYVWTNPNGDVVGQAIDYTLTDNTGSGIYTVTATDNCGQTHSETVLVTIYDELLVDSILTTSADTIVSQVFEGQSITIDAFTSPSPLAGATYEWLLNGELFLTTTDPTTGPFFAPQVEQDGVQFEFDVIITDANGCTTTQTVTLIVNDNPVEIPNAFSPGNDDINNTFKPVSAVDVIIEEFRIYNRWGQLVYDNEDGTSGWDGMQDGKPAPSDVYVYYLVYKIAEESPAVSEKGDVTLLR